MGATSAEGGFNKGPGLEDLSQHPARKDFPVVQKNQGIQSSILPERISQFVQKHQGSRRSNPQDPGSTSHHKSATSYGYWDTGYLPCKGTWTTEQTP